MRRLLSHLSRLPVLDCACFLTCLSFCDSFTGSCQPMANRASSRQSSSNDPFFPQEHRISPSIRFQNAREGICCLYNVSYDLPAIYLMTLFDVHMDFSSCPSTSLLCPNFPLWLDGCFLSSYLLFHIFFITSLNVSERNDQKKASNRMMTRTERSYSVNLSIRLAGWMPPSF